MDGAMSWLAVIVVVLVIALPILFCRSSCACCRSCGIGILKGTWLGVKGSCNLSWKLMKYLYRKQQSSGRRDEGCSGGIVADEGEELSEVISDPVPSARTLDPVLVVPISPNLKRIIVICKFESENFFYNLLNLDTGIVFDDIGSNRDILRPDPELLEKVRIEMRTVKVPLMMLNGNRKILVNFPSIYFDPEKARYRNIRTGVEESRFRKPIY